jgi:phosphohistidine phosphatase SixA
MVVGHMPHLPRLLALLLAAPDSTPEFPPHGVVALEADADRWKEVWRAG